MGMDFRAGLYRMMSGALAVASAGAVHGEGYEAIPSEITLTHRGALHGVVVERVAEGQHRGDAEAALTSSDPAVVTINEQGMAEAVGDGTATITATVDGQTLSIPVTVRGAGTAFTPSFRNDIQPVMYRMGCNTGACHGAAAGKNGFRLSLRGYDDAFDYKSITREANGRRVSLSEPHDSLVLLKPIMDVAHEGGERFQAGSESHRLLLDWLRAGAPPATDADKQIERIEVFPKSVTLDAASSQRLLVHAYYSDGSYADVTRWAAFDTTDETVVVVDADGKVTVEGPGAGNISVWFASQVTAAQFTVPRAAEPAPSLFAEAERFNFVDDHVLAQLEELKIPPAGLADDMDFIRRVYLDAMGVLPEPEEVRDFVLDDGAEKRAALIDTVMARTEFVDYWSYMWSDLLLVSSKKLTNRPEMMALYGFIRESVADNKPWDRFVRDILTAQGNTLDNGAAAYYVMHKETIDLTETTSQAFLGMSLTCARCHNHPLEKWTQTQYYGMANLLSRVKLKNGAGGRGTDVLAAEYGDILHPRLGAPVPPTPLDGASIALASTADRRTALADWMTSAENPYFARAIVNRVWANYMGRGLVESVDDLRLTNPASNEALLNALADDFAAKGFDLRHLMRTIMTSAAYQRVSYPAVEGQPDGKYYSHYVPRRLPAEVLLDAYAQVTGVPTKFDGYPEGFRALQLPDSAVGSYFLTAFGRPERNQTCTCERTNESNVAQTLHIANGDTLNGKIRDDRSRPAKYAAEDMSDVAAMDDLYLRALGRYPRPDERIRTLEMLANLPEGDRAEQRRLAFEDLAWALLTGKEFLFNH